MSLAPSGVLWQVCARHQARPWEHTTDEQEEGGAECMYVHFRCDYCSFRFKARAATEDEALEADARARQHVRQSHLVLVP